MLMTCNDGVQRNIVHPAYVSGRVLPQLLREPNQVHKERKAQEAAANAEAKAAQRARQDEKSRVKGKNKPTRRQRKKQLNIIEDKKPTIKARQAEEVRRGVAPGGGRKWWGGGHDAVCDVWGVGVVAHARGRQQSNWNADEDTSQ